MDTSRHDHHVGGADHQTSRMPAIAGVVLTILGILGIMLLIGLWVL